MRAVRQFNAIVTKIDDPEKRGRFKVKCSEITGDPDLELPDFVEPCLPWGWFAPPDIGEEVEIEAVDFDDQAEDVPSQAFIEEPDYKWRGVRFQSTAGEQPRPVDSFFTGTNYSKRRGFATPNGHVLMFDDTPGAEQLTLSWKKNDEAKFAYLSFDKTGSALMMNQNGTMIHLDAENGQFKIIDENSNVIASDENGIKIIDKFSNIVELKEAAIQVFAQKDAIVQAGANIKAKAPKIIAEATNVEINSGNIKVGNGADSPFVRYSEWKQWAENHTHPTAFGPSGVPAVPPPASVASTSATVK